MYEYVHQFNHCKAGDDCTNHKKVDPQESFDKFELKMKQLRANLWKEENGFTREDIKDVQTCCQRLRKELITDMSELKSDNEEAIALIKASKAFQLDKSDSE